VQISYGDLQWLAQGVAGHADDAVVLDPPELVSAVVRRLRAAATS
jgi:predicted DNA-binding transcriptional regulator YafY